ncbi:MAG: hypothetical protein QGF59_12165, partial [Pirellulaceae bacterium]|nr:hypothetical protein [Pirellulaceae bacterium]
MVDITLNDNASPVIDATPDNTDLLRRIQREMLRLASSGPTKAELLQGLAEWMSAFAQPLEVFYCERDEQDQLADAIQLDHTAADDHDDRFYQQLTSACHTACRTGELDVRRWATPPRMIVAAPIPLRGSDPEAIGVVFSENNSTPHDMMLVQMVVS